MPSTKGNVCMPSFVTRSKESILNVFIMYNPPKSVIFISITHSIGPCDDEAFALLLANNEKEKTVKFHIS